MDGGSWFKAKARIVAQGFRDPHLPLLSRDAPVLSRAGLFCLLQWASTHHAPLFNGDCKSSFLQGVDEWNHDSEVLYELSAPVYGQANAC